MKYKFGFIILFIFLFFAFNGCDKNKSANEAKIKIGTSIEPLANLIQKIGGDRVEVIRLIPAGICLESYEAKTEDLKKLANVDAFIKMGNFFQFENSLIEKLNLNKEKVFDCTESIVVVDGNPHIWLSPKNAKILAENIAKFLSGIDKKYANNYTDNKNKVLSELDDIIKRFDEKIKNNNTKILIDAHPFWRYIAEDFGLTEYSIEQEGKETTTKYLKELIEIGKKNKIKKVYISPYSKDQTSLIIAQELKAELVELDPFPKDYIKNFEDILNKL